jgi:sulfide:quinone oxidoreductase
MSTPDVLRTSKLVNETGFVPVNKQTLQHTEYPNIFALGDNANSPNAKTAAAIGMLCIDIVYIYIPCVAYF